MKRFANIALYCSAFLIAAHFAAAGNPAPEFEKKFWTILEGEKAALKLDNAETKLEWSSDNPSVAKVNAKGEVTGTGYGIANITASGKGVKVSVPVYVLVKGFGELGRPLDEEMIFSHQVKIIRNAVMQCFDIDSNGEIYYIQVGGLLKQALFVQKSFPDNPAKEHMRLFYFGHGSNFSVEEEGDKRFVWVSSNASKAKNGHYWDSQTFSRVEFEDGKTLYHDGGETFYMGGKVNLCPAVDIESGMVAVAYSGKNRGFYLRAYDIKEARALPDEEIELKPIRFGGEKEGPKEQTVTRRIKAKNLERLKPLAELEIKRSSKPDEDFFYPYQGFEISRGLLYFYEGLGNTNNPKDGGSNAYLTVYNLKGEKVSERTRISAVDDMEALKKFLLTDTGYMEAEGVKIKNGKLYLAMASRNKKDERRANIFKY